MPLLPVVNLRARDLRATRIRAAERHRPRLAISRQNDTGSIGLFATLFAGCQKRVIVDHLIRTPVSGGITGIGNLAVTLKSQALRPSRALRPRFSRCRGTIHRALFSAHLCKLCASALSFLFSVPLYPELPPKGHIPLEMFTNRSNRVHLFFRAICHKDINPFSNRQGLPARSAAL